MHGRVFVLRIVLNIGTVFLAQRAHCTTYSLAKVSCVKLENESASQPVYFLLAIINQYIYWMVARTTCCNKTLSSTHNMFGCETFCLKRTNIFFFSIRSFFFSLLFSIQWDLCLVMFYFWWLVHASWNVFVHICMTDGWMVADDSWFHHHPVSLCARSLSLSLWMPLCYVCDFSHLISRLIYVRIQPNALRFKLQIE